MYAADLNEIRRHRPRRFGYVMRVGEHDGRFDGIHRVVRLRTVSHHRPLHVPYGQDGINEKRRRLESLVKRFRHRVVGHQIRYRRRVRDVTEQIVFDVRYHGRGYRVHQGHVQSGRDVRRAFRRRDFRENHIVAGPAVVVVTVQDVLHPAVVVNELTVVTVDVRDKPYHRAGFEEIFEQKRCVQIGVPRQRVRNVHLRVVGRVAVGKRREHSNAVTVF